MSSLPLSPAFSGQVDLALTLCKTIDSPRSLAVYLLLKGGEWQQYLDLPWDQKHYECPQRFAEDRLVTEILRKSRDMPIGEDLEAKAVASFYEAEDCNRRTNVRLEQTAACDHPLWWRKACLEIDRILGPLDRKALNKIEQSCKHGAGGAVGVRAEGLVPSDKFDAIPSVTEKLVPFVPSIMEETWREYRPHHDVVQGNEFFTVPKKATQLRECAKGPLLGVYLQLGIGSYMRDRLLMHGVNLRDQGRNQRLAGRCHISGGATLDLKSASDLMALEVPRRLILNDRWVHLLELGREDYTEVDGKWVELEKFCAMGNGFTFALQSVIFWGVIRALVPPLRWDECAVYGDDMILPQKYAPALVEALEYLGFKVNWEKSCLAGNFFESCGTDWFKGLNVRPFYLGTEDNTSLPPALQQANKLRLWTQRLCNGLACDSRFRSIWTSLSKRVPSIFRKCRVPLSAGDTGLIVSFQEARPFIRRIKDDRRTGGEGWQGWEYSAINLVPMDLDKRSFGCLLSALTRRVTEVPEYDVPPSLREYLRLMGLSNPSPATYGLEPRRGYLRLVTSRWTTVDKWSDGLDWA